MSNKSKIEWTDATWNPVTGCTKVSQGCKHCYAERMISRFDKTRVFTDVQLHPDRLQVPFKWLKPRKIFVNSMSDLFHEDVPFEFIADVFAAMWVTTRHTYQVLTKRPERMKAFFDWLNLDPYHDVPWSNDDFQIDPLRVWPQWTPINGNTGGYDNCGPIWPMENVWLGVSVENQETANERIPLLLDIPAAVRWISAEPLLEPVSLDRLLLQPGGQYRNSLTGEVHGFYTNYKDFPKLDWVVVGGESGPNARPMDPHWVRDLRDQCDKAGTPFLLKQWGEYKYIEETGLPAMKESSDKAIYSAPAIDIPGRFIRVGKKNAGRLLDGKLWDQYPT